MLLSNKKTSEINSFKLMAIPSPASYVARFGLPDSSSGNYLSEPGSDDALHFSGSVISDVVDSFSRVADLDVPGVEK